MRFQRAFVAAGILCLASCSQKAPPPPAADLMADDSIGLCAAYHQYAKEYPDPAEAAKIKQEIGQRGDVPASEWPYIDRGEIVLGMSQCGALAAWGRPEANRQTITPGGQTIQFVYGNQSVYTNGKTVTAVR